MATWALYFKYIFFFGEFRLSVFVLIEFFVVLLCHKLLEVGGISKDWIIQQ